MKEKSINILNIRIPRDVKEELEKAAQGQFRSLNNEVVKRLVESLQRDKAQVQPL